jgi:hypothetical protein
MRSAGLPPTGREVGVPLNLEGLQMLRQREEVCFLALFDEGETTFLQYAAGGVIVDCDLGVQRPLRHDFEEHGQGACGDAFAPVVPPQPIADLPPAIILEEADDVPGHLVVEQDSPLDDRLVGQDPTSERHERIPIAGREIGYGGSLRIELIREEQLQIRLRHLPQRHPDGPATDYAYPPSGSSVRGRYSLAFMS